MSTEIKDPELLGKTDEFTTPSKFKVTIREQNGDDDDVISRMKNANDGSSINKFLAGIIMDTSLSPGQRLGPGDIAKWKNKDRYFILLRSRLHSLGSEVNFTHACSSCNKETKWEEDLKQFDRDFSLPDDKSSNKTKYQCTSYPQGLETKLELSTSRGKKLRYTLLNGEIEKKQLDLDKNEISKNTPITLRELEWFHEEKWQKVENFRAFSPKEMVEIRKHIAENDDGFDGWSDMKCPFCGHIDTVSLIAQSDFLFPGETL